MFGPRGSAVVLHIDMDSFYAAVEQLRRPGLRGRPVVVGHDGPRGVVAAASYEARRFGVRSAMPSVTARRLCPQAIFIEADFQAYREKSAAVFAVLSSYTPVVEPLSLDEAFLDLSGSREARERPAEVGARLKEEVHAATGGLTASVGIATCKVVAKIASEHRKPDGLVVVPPGEEAAFMAPLPLRALPGLGPAAERRLSGLGLNLVGDLAALPPEALEARLGSAGMELGRLARGIDPRPVVVPGMPRSISREVTFERDVTDRERLRRTVRTLGQDVTRSLRARDLWARTVRLKIRFAGFETHTFQSTLGLPTDLDREFLAAADRLLAQALPEARPVRLVGIGAAGLAEISEELPLDSSRARQRTLDQSLDRLRRRFGATAISRGTVSPVRQLDWRRDDVDAARGEAEA